MSASALKMLVVCRAVCHVQSRAAHGPSQAHGEDLYVGGDLSKVFVLPPDQIDSYHHGMRVVLVIALLVGIALLQFSDFMSVVG